MAYRYTNSRGKTYILHHKVNVTKTGKKQTLYFFSSTEREGALDMVPAGYTVGETKSGLPVLKKI
jgi:hypothetical protein